MIVPAIPSNTASRQGGLRDVPGVVPSPVEVVGASAVTGPYYAATAGRGL